MASGGRGTELRRRLALIAAGAGVLLVALLAATTQRPAIVGGHGSSSSPSPTPTSSPATAPAPGAAIASGASGNTGLTALAVLGVLAIVLLLVLVIAGMVLGAGQLDAARRRRRDARPASPEARTLAGSVRTTAVADALPDLLSAVRAGSPRAGIIAGWVRLEGLAAEAGVRPRRSETPSELTIRVLDGMDVPGRWVLRLADLYREARFSDHPMTEADRSDAQDCLQALAAGAPEPTTGVRR